MIKKKKRVSFDFDGTLNGYFTGGINMHEDEVRALFVELIKSGEYDVYIITRRYGPEDCDKGVGNEHEPVFNLVKELKVELPKEKILFTNRKYKYSLINSLGIDIHLDDDGMEHQLIKKFSTGSSVDVENSDWRQKFDELL